MLSAQFAALFQPVMEETGSGLHQLERLERDVLEALGLVVAVDFLEMAVEQGREGCRVGGGTRELD